MSEEHKEEKQVEGWSEKRREKTFGEVKQEKKEKWKKRVKMEWREGKEEVK